MAITKTKKYKFAHNMVNLYHKKIGRWFVLKRLYKRKNGRALWLCKCDCGNIKEVNSTNLIRKTSKSCGCLSREILLKRLLCKENRGKNHPCYKHGRTGTKELAFELRLKNIYGITVKYYKNLLKKQDNKCVLCEKNFHKKRICIDHNHQNGKIRGLLCNGCNNILGNSHDNIDILMRAINYLKERN